MCAPAPLHCWIRGLGHLEGWAGLCWTSCWTGSLPHSSSLPYFSSAPEALLLCGCQIILGTDCRAVDHWISAQLEGRGGLDLARGSCPQPYLQGINADSQLCIGPDWGHLALLYTGSNLLKFGTPQLRN